MRYPQQVWHFTVYTCLPEMLICTSWKPSEPADFPQKNKLPQWELFHAICCTCVKHCHSGNFYGIFPLLCFLQHCIVVTELACLMPLGLISYHSCFNTCALHQFCPIVRFLVEFLVHQTSWGFQQVTCMLFQHLWTWSGSKWLRCFYLAQNTELPVCSSYRAEFSDDDDAEISTSLNFNMVVDSITKPTNISHTCFSFLISQLCRF